MKKCLAGGCTATVPAKAMEWYDGADDDAGHAVNDESVE